MLFTYEMEYSLARECSANVKEFGPEQGEKGTDKDIHIRDGISPGEREQSHPAQGSIHAV
jgi:hypothetical protein